MPIRIRRRGVIARVATFQPSGPGSIPGGGQKFLIPILGLGVCPLSVLSCAVYGGVPDIVLTTHSGRPALVYV